MNEPMNDLMQRNRITGGRDSLWQRAMNLCPSSYSVIEPSSHATRARCILAVAAVVVLAALPFAAAEQVLQRLPVRFSWGHTSASARPFRIGCVTNAGAITQIRSDGFEVGDILVMMDDQPVESVDGLAFMLELMKPRQAAAIAVIDHRTGQAGIVKAEVR